LQFAPGRQVAIGAPSLATSRTRFTGLQFAPGRQVAIGAPSLATSRTRFTGLQFAPGRQVAIGAPSLEVIGVGRLTRSAGWVEALAVTVNAINERTATNEYFFMVFSPTSRT
jgi:hypothetical protein